MGVLYTRTPRGGAVLKLENEMKVAPHLRGIVLAVAGYTCFVLCDSVIKFAGSSLLPNYEIVGCMGFFMALALGVYTAWKTTLRDLLPKRPYPVLLRSLLDLGNNLFVVVALRHLSLTLFYILVFTSPLVASLAGRVFLKEPLGLRRVSALLAGFLGVLVAVYPLRHSGGSAWTGVAACVVCVACFSTGLVLSRVLLQTERGSAVAFCSGAVSAAAGLVGLFVGLVPVSAALLFSFAVMGVLAAVGSLCILAALRRTAVSTVSQFHYTQLASGALVSYLVFHEAPTRWLAAGAVLIVASGLYVAMRVPPTKDDSYDVALP